MRYPLYTDVDEQIRATYQRMAWADYRPAAPSDGHGNITVDHEDLDIEDEARRYAEKWWEEEDGHSYWIGCCNFSTRPATIFAVEAARLLCGGDTGNAYALRLLRMAVEDLEEDE